MSGRSDNYHIHIEGGQSPLSLNLREIWRYRDLIVLFTRRTMALKYKQTVLGPLWAIIQPLMTTVVFSIVFGSLAKLTTSDVRGEVLKIPNSTIINDNNKITYTVKKGDTLYSIARTYNTTPDEIKKINNLKNNTLSVGETLILPNINS